MNIQDVECETRDARMRQDEQLMKFISSATSALLTTTDSKGIVRLLLQAYLDQIKVWYLMM